MANILITSGDEEWLIKYGWGNLFRELLSCKFSTWNEIIQIYDFNSGCFYNKCVTILNERTFDLFYVFSVFMVRPSYCHKRRHYFLLSPCPASAQHHDRTCNNFEGRQQCCAGGGDWSGDPGGGGGDSLSAGAGEIIWDW